MTAKDIVLKFYNSNAILSKSYLEDVLHDELVLEWTNSKSKIFLDKNDVLALSKDIRLAYYSMRAVVHHVLDSEDRVAINYTHYVAPFENPDEEVVLATYFVLWEVKEGQLYRGYQISQLIND